MKNQAAFLSRWSRARLCWPLCNGINFSYLMRLEWVKFFMTFQKNVSWVGGWVLHWEKRSRRNLFSFDLQKRALTWDYWSKSITPMWPTYLAYPPDVWVGFVWDPLDPRFECAEENPAQGLGCNVAFQSIDNATTSRSTVQIWKVKAYCFRGQVFSFLFCLCTVAHQMQRLHLRIINNSSPCVLFVHGWT